MQPRDSKNEDFCSKQQIIAYIEGDLLPREEMDLEVHFARCRTCADEVNVQKNLLRSLDLALENDELDFEVPDDFTKVVVTSAQSNVQGLRRPQERVNSLLVCLALILFVLVGFGNEAAGYINVSEQLPGQVWSFGSSAFQLLYDIGIGGAVILRCYSQRFVFNSPVSLGVLLIFFVMTGLALTRLIVGQYRA